jgi:metallo-beta-lactamase family protein
MKVRFLGAVGTVTGSCSWLQDPDRGWNFLVDCGMHQDESNATQDKSKTWPFDPATLQFVALTHAHLDHCGLLPALYRDGFEGPVRCTSETAELARLVLNDAARIPNSGFCKADVDRIQWKPFREDQPFGQPRPVDQDLFLRTYRSGHIPGAASIEVLWGAPGPGQRNIVFSGDLGPGSEDDEVAPMLRFPWNPRSACFAVLESTYGGTVRTPLERDPKQRLVRLHEVMTSIVETGGTLLLPAFAVGRAQDLMFDIHAVVASEPQRFREMRIVLDAPLARSVQGVVAQAMQRVDVMREKVRPLWLGKQVFRQLGLDDTEPDDIQAALDIIKMTLTGVRGDEPKLIPQGNGLAQQWRALTEPPTKVAPDRSRAPEGPTVIVCGSADGCGGAAAGWLPTLLRDTRHIIATTGYTSPLSVMGRITMLADLPLKERRRHPGHIEWPNGRALPIRDVSASLTRLRGYSAHADQIDLLNWVFLHRQNGDGVVAPTLFVQHGEDREREALRSAILQRAAKTGQHINVVLPQREDHWISLEGQPAIQTASRNVDSASVPVNSLS